MPDPNSPASEKTLKVLNLYAGIGGNRKLWKNVQVTAVENDPDIAKVYQDFFPNDTVIIGDAHEYLLEHYQEFDLIWASPPCQSHSSFRQNICVTSGQSKPGYIDLKLYQEIIFLEHNYKGIWLVENVRPYYEPLIKPTAVIARHYYWSNKPLIIDIKASADNIHYAQIPELSLRHGFDLSNYKLKNKRQVLRNCVSPEVGEYLFNSLAERTK